MTNTSTQNINASGDIQCGGIASLPSVTSDNVTTINMSSQNVTTTNATVTNTLTLSASAPTTNVIACTVSGASVGVKSTDLKALVTQTFGNMTSTKLTTSSVVTSNMTVGNATATNLDLNGSLVFKSSNANPIIAFQHESNELYLTRPKLAPLVTNTFPLSTTFSSGIETTSMTLTSQTAPIVFDNAGTDVTVSTANLLAITNNSYATKANNNQMTGSNTFTQPLTIQVAQQTGDYNRVTKAGLTIRSNTDPADSLFLGADTTQNNGVGILQYAWDSLSPSTILYRQIAINPMGGSVCINKWPANPWDNSVALDVNGLVACTTLRVGSTSVTDATLANMVKKDATNNITGSLKMVNESIIFESNFPSGILNTGSSLVVSCQGNEQNIFINNDRGADFGDVRINAYSPNANTRIESGHVFMTTTLPINDNSNKLCTSSYVQSNLQNYISVQNDNTFEGKQTFNNSITLQNTLFNAQLHDANFTLDTNFQCHLLNKTTGDITINLPYISNLRVNQDVPIFQFRNMSSHGMIFKTPALGTNPIVKIVNTNNDITDTLGFASTNYIQIMYYADTATTGKWVVLHFQ